MATFTCGGRIRSGAQPTDHFGAAGCLVQFIGRTEVLLLTAAHVLVCQTSRQNDSVVTADASAVQLGGLTAWTQYDGDTTVDAALVLVDPNLVSPQVQGLGAITGVNLAPNEGDKVFLCAAPGRAEPRQMKIQQGGLGATVQLDIATADWSGVVTYTNQILCEPMTPVQGEGGVIGGDSGAVVLDADNRVVGMVVGGNEVNNYTVVTPINAILNNADFGGVLQVVTSLDGLKPTPAQRNLALFGQLKPMQVDTTVPPAPAVAPRMPLDIGQAQAYLQACEAAHVAYVWGCKAKFTDTPGVDFQAIDCSGFVRQLILHATAPQVAFPDGSVVQHAWVAKAGYAKSSVAAGRLQDGKVRIAFLPPGWMPNKAGHVVLIYNGATLESHSNAGPSSRPWAGQGWQGLTDVYQLT